MWTVSIPNGVQPPTILTAAWTLPVKGKAQCDALHSFLSDIAVINTLNGSTLRDRLAGRFSLGGTATVTLSFVEV